MEGSMQEFCASSSLLELVSMIGLDTKINSICSLVRNDLAHSYGCRKVICARFHSNSASIIIEGISDLTSEIQTAMEINESSGSWIIKQPADMLIILDDSRKMEKFLLDITKAGESDAIVILLGKDFDGLRHLVILTAGRESIESIEKSRKGITDLLLGVAIILEDLRRMKESQIMRFNIQSVFELAPVGIIICDSDGSVINANEQAVIILGCGPGSDALIGENLLSGETFRNSGIEEVLKRASAGEQVDIENLRFKCPSGKNVNIYARFRPTRASDGKLRVICIMADVTQRIRLQQQLERSYRSLTDAYQELQRIDKMKTRFIDTVSHELRTPLTVMRGYLELIQSEYEGKMDQKTMAKIKSIRANTERLYDLVESMLDVARMEQGAMEIIKQETSIKHLLEEVLESQKGFSHDKHQEITFVIQGEVGSVRLDHRKMRDAIKNILNNAIRYTPEGGKIQMGAEDQGKLVHIWIKDNGIGVPTADLEKIFDRFHIVVAKELSHQVDRMGLGLPLAKGVIEAHGGKIWVESEVGKGSVFHLNIPKE